MSDGVVVALNMHSRKASQSAELVQELCRRHGLPIRAFHPARDDDELLGHVKRAIAGGARAVLVGGGDGTLTHAVGAFAYTKAVLGVLPLGTGNSFARTVGLDPHDLDGAIAAVAGGHVAKVDLGRCNGTYFANFATVGLSSEIADATPHMLKALAGKLAYALAAAIPMLSGKGFRVRIRWPAGKCEFVTRDVVVCVGRYYGATPVTPEAAADDGELALVALEGGSAISALETYAAFGAHVQTMLPNAHVIRATRFRIKAKPKQLLSLDGAVMNKKNARFSVAPAALRVFVPAGGIAR